MERIITAIETIEANSARMFGLEDKRTQVVFMFTDVLRTLFENEEAAAGSPATEHGVVGFNDLLEMDEEEATKVIADLSLAETKAVIREGMDKLLEELW